jgi:putative ABC transport system permease protein
MLRVGPMFRILDQNIRRNVRSLILSAFGIVVGVAALVFFWGLSEGVSKVVLHDIFPIDRVEVISPRTSITGTALTLDDDLVAKIKQRPEVRGAYPKLRLAFPAAGVAYVMGRTQHFEVGGFCDGIDPALVAGDPGARLFKDWDVEEAGKMPACAAVPDPDNQLCPKDHYCGADGLCHHRIPVLVSRTLLEIYNGSFAKSHGLPTIGSAQEAVIAHQLERLYGGIDLGRSLVATGNVHLRAPVEHVEAMLVGISAKAIPIGATIPIGYLRRWNERFVGEAEARSYSSIVVDLKARSGLASFYPWIKSLGFEQDDSQGERIALVITVVRALFLLIAFIIMFISALNISHTFFMIISERKRELGLMRALGAARGDVWKMILGESVVIGVVGGVTGVAIALGAARLLDYLNGVLLGAYPFKPQTYFAFSPELLALALVFAIAFCVFGAFLPARQAARLPPAQALQG